MSRRSRIRRVPDLGRLREAMSGPGADPRSWVVLARVDDDDDAIRWDTGTGWVADVTFVFGDLAGEGPVACRVASIFGGDGVGSFQPVQRGAEVLVLLPGGDPNTAPMIVGVGFNPEDLPVPETVNGQTIDEDFALANHILVTEHSVQQEVGPRWRTEATERATLAAPEVRLADEDAGQAFVRGNAQADALKDLVDALDAFAQALATAPPAVPNGALTVASVAVAYANPLTGLAVKLTRAKTAIDNALSTKIKGE